jgi:hypothetical protein
MGNENMTASRDPVSTTDTELQTAQMAIVGT